MSETKKLFGYSFDEIRNAQQGHRLGKVIDTSKPATKYDPECERQDLELLHKYGEEKLREMGYMGVIDRLSRGGHLGGG